MATDEAFKAAQERFTKVLTNMKVKVEEEDKSDDFSKAPPERWVGPVPKIEIDKEALLARARKLSVYASCRC